MRGCAVIFSGLEFHLTNVSGFCVNCVLVAFAAGVINIALAMSIQTYKDTKFSK